MLLYEQCRQACDIHEHLRRVKWIVVLISTRIPVFHCRVYVCFFVKLYVLYIKLYVCSTLRNGTLCSIVHIVTKYQAGKRSFLLHICLFYFLFLHFYYLLWEKSSGVPLRLDPLSFSLLTLQRAIATNCTHTFLHTKRSQQQGDNSTYNHALILMWLTYLGAFQLRHLRFAFRLIVVVVIVVVFASCR